MRWRQIKGWFSRHAPAGEHRSASRIAKGERGIWHRRYWEHLVRDEDDLQRHVDYIHFNPVKHGHVARAVDWPYSTLHRFVAMGWWAVDRKKHVELQSLMPISFAVFCLKDKD